MQQAGLTAPGPSTFSKAETAAKGDHTVLNPCSFSRACEIYYCLENKTDMKCELLADIAAIFLPSKGI
jgi:hypothetical protein